MELELVVDMDRDDTGCAVPPLSRASLDVLSWSSSSCPVPTETEAAAALAVILPSGAWFAEGGMVSSEKYFLNHDCAVPLLTSSRGASFVLISSWCLSN